MLKLSRLPRKAAMIFVAAAAVLIVAPHPAAATARHQAAHGTAAGAHAKPIPATTLAATEPVSGPCSVPGIGDIGGLLGFCSLGSSGLIGSLNNLCDPGTPAPESASTGVDALISPPAPAGRPLPTPYNEYGMAGQSWNATDLQCSDMTSLIGNDVAGMLFDFAKALDRVTITVYQSAAGEGILGWLQGVTDRMISGLGNAIYFPYVAVIVILAAIWLAWQGLIRKRGTRTIEGTIWMVVACAAAIWLIGRPADFTGLGKGVSDGISTTLNAAFANLPSPGQPSCLPVKAHDPQISEASFSYTSGRTVVDQNANELWTVLVCKPWLDGEFGTTAMTASGKPTAAAQFARPLLWSQAIAVNEKPTTALINAKESAYTGIAQTIKQQDPSVYPLFQGKEWTTRLEIAFAALLAALVAGVLVLLISVTLILLKLGFLLLLIVGPFFLLIGTHPGFGRVVAVRWFEMLVGVLLKQAAVALALSVLLYCYALIMGTSDAVLPWALKILMITLVTVAVFIYRKPFQHLFAAVGYGAIGATERAEADLSRAAATARANTATAATLGVPGYAAYRMARWARRNPAQAAGLALGAATAVGAGAVAAGLGSAGAADGGAAAGTGEYGGSPDPAAAGASTGVGARARSWGASAGSASASEAPPLKLPVSQSAPVSWAKNGAPGGSSAGSGAGSRGRGGVPPGPSGGRNPAAGPPPAVRPSASTGQGSGSRRRSSGPPAWTGTGGGAGPSVRPDSDRAPRSGRPARPPLFSGQGWSGQGGSSADRSDLGRGRTSSDRGGSDRGRSGGGSSGGGAWRRGRSGGGAGPGGDADAGQGNFSVAPYGLTGDSGDDHDGPFWSRSSRRRK